MTYAEYIIYETNYTSLIFRDKSGYTTCFVDIDRHKKEYNEFITILNDKIKNLCEPYQAMIIYELKESIDRNLNTNFHTFLTEEFNARNLRNVNLPITTYANLTYNLVL